MYTKYIFIYINLKIYNIKLLIKSDILYIHQYFFNIFTKLWVGKHRGETCVIILRIL